MEIPCYVTPPVVPLRAEDFVLNADQTLTLSQDAVVRLGQSITLWVNHLKLVKERCGPK